MMRADHRKRTGRSGVCGQMISLQCFVRSSEDLKTNVAYQYLLGMIYLAG